MVCGQKVMRILLKFCTKAIKSPLLIIARKYQNACHAWRTIKIINLKRTCDLLQL